MRGFRTLIAVLPFLLSLSVATEVLVTPLVPERETSDLLSNLSSVVTHGMRLSNDGVDLKKEKVVIDLVILIYTYGYHSIRYNLTEKMFLHYRNVQQMFQEFATITFTIVGSEKNVSQDLSLKYFPRESYFELYQKPVFSYTKISVVYDAITTKLRFGLRRSFKRPNNRPDVIIWVGSNDYIALSFWRQVIEEYNPTRMETFGIGNSELFKVPGNFRKGGNAIFHTTYDGKHMQSRHDNSTLWHSGYTTDIRRQSYHYIGALLGVTRSVFLKYPHLLKKWDCDEGRDELRILREGDIQAMNSSDCFFMNIKGTNRQDVTKVTGRVIKRAISNKNVVIDSTTEMKKSFLLRFDLEFQYFDSLLR